MLRLVLILPRSFPVGDGGLWHEIAAALISGNLRLPETIVFNGADFPLVYPPLAGYLVAVLALSTGIAAVEILTWLPFFLSLLTIVAFFFFVRAYFRDFKTAALAVLLFPLAVQSTTAFVAGGGVSRGLGVTFQLMAWYLACRREWTPSSAVVIGFIAALAVLSHPTAALWTIAGIVFFGVLERRFSGWSLIRILAAAAAFSAPWWAFILSRHGLSPLVLAFQTGGQEMFNWRLFGSPEKLLLPNQTLGAFALIGMFFLLRDRLTALPALLLMGLMFDRRGLFVLNGVTIAVPAAALAIQDIFKRCLWPKESARAAGGLTAAQALFIGVLLIHLVFSSVAFVHWGRVYLSRPAAGDIYSFKKARDLLPEGTILYVRSARETIDTAEWFAVFSQRQIIPLAQGQEWSGRYGRMISACHELEKCCELGSLGCIENAIGNNMRQPDFIAIDRVSCPLFGEQLNEFPLAADLPALRIWRLRQPE